MLERDLYFLWQDVVGGRCGREADVQMSDVLNRMAIRKGFKTRITPHIWRVFRCDDSRRWVAFGCKERRGLTSKTYSRDSESQADTAPLFDYFVPTKEHAQGSWFSRLIRRFAGLL